MDAGSGVPTDVPGQTPGGELVHIDSVRPLTRPEAFTAPVYGVRADSPGPRGCWSLNKRGEPCSAARRADSDYCNAHSGIGISADPKGHSRIGVARSAEVRRRRATLRLALGGTRLNTPRGVLKAMAFADAERVAAAALAGATDPSVPLAQRSRHALALIDAVEPLAQAELELTLPTNPEGVELLGLEELQALARQVRSSES